jgi:serine/threonine-protein kinase
MRGVAAAHRMGVVHRDLKPDNIFLARDSDGNYVGPKVLDFGISKVSTEGQVDPRLTKTGAVVGTPYYMSPEQIRGAADVDKRADVYAFGVIMYECLTGRVPFDADNYGALILEIATGTARRPRELNPDLPEPLENIVMKAMAREKDQRYPDMESLIDALEPFASRVTFSVRASNPAHRRLTTAQVTSTPFVSELPAPMPPRNWAGMAAAGVAIVLVGGVGGWLLVGGGRSDEPTATQAAQAPAAPVAEPPTPTPATPEPAAAPSPAPAPVTAAPALAAPDAGVRGAAHAEAAPPQAPQAPVVAAPPPQASAEPARSERRAPAREARRPAAPAASPAPVEPAAPRPGSRAGGRTGALDVGEF